MGSATLSRRHAGAVHWPQEASYVPVYDSRVAAVDAGVAGLILGWTIDRRNSASDRAFRASLIKIDGDVYLDCGGELNGLPGIVYLKPPSPTSVVPGQRPRF